MMEIVSDMPKGAPTINVEGKRGDSLFYRPIGWTVKDDLKLISSQYKEYAKLVTEAEEERLLAIVGNLSLEEALDLFLGAFIPSYKRLSENRDFSLSMKIDLARSLRLIPRHILDAVDLIRKIRNEFTHKLRLNSFDSLNDTIKRRLRQRSKELYPNDKDTEISYAVEFEKLVDATIFALEIYTSHVRIARQFIYGDDFIGELSKRVKSKPGKK
jgi:hypothetical protein